MFPLLAALKSLHDLDQEILILQHQIEAARRELAARQAELASAEKALEDLRAKDKEAKAGEGLKEVELKDLEGQIVSWTVKLNTTRDNKEYQAILHQIGTIKEQKGKLEEEIIGLLDAGEGVTSHMKDEEKHVLETRRGFEARRREQEAVVQARQAEADALSQRRAGLAVAVSPDALARYERIRTHRQGMGLAAVEADNCQGCHMGLTPNQANQLQQERELVFCQSCGRILYPA